MCYRKHWTDILTRHTGNVADLVQGNRIEFTRKSCRLWADGYTSTAVDTGVPVEVEDDGRVFHIE